MTTDPNACRFAGLPGHVCRDRDDRTPPRAVCHLEAHVDVRSLDRGVVSQVAATLAVTHPWLQRVERPHEAITFATDVAWAFAARLVEQVERGRDRAVVLESECARLRDAIAEAATVDLGELESKLAREWMGEEA